MPELPEPKRRLDEPASEGAGFGGESVSGERTGGLTPPRSPGVSYAELHCRTNFSFLEGASHPDELVQTAARLGYQALAITDRNSLAGVVRAHVAAKEAGLKLLIGAEVTPRPGSIALTDKREHMASRVASAPGCSATFATTRALTQPGSPESRTHGTHGADVPPAVLLATDRRAYGRLCRLLTHGRRNAPKGECFLTLDDLAEHADGLLCCVPLKHLLASGEPTEALDRYREIFSDRCYALAELHLGPDDRGLLERMRQVAGRHRLPLVAANDVHYHEPQRQFLAEILAAIREGCPVAELGRRRFPNGERYLKSLSQLSALFADCPDALDRTVEIAGRCRFSLDELRYDYPEELCPAGMTPLEHLTRLTWQGAHDRYPDGIPEKIRGLIEHELQLIAELRYEAYFLTVWDLVRFARSRGILCQGRGSAANSAVCFCLGVTSVDPDRIDVLFERFVSKERNEAPDIDVDFEHARREEVIQYVYEKYGRDRAAMTAEVICYRPRSAVREVSKALGLSLDRADALSKSLEHYSDNDKLARRFREAGLAPTSRIGRQIVGFVRQLVDFPRHLSQHVGGLVITQGPLCELVPIENATMPGRTVIQWDKDDLDALGILKVDCLALGMLTAIHKCFDFIERHDERPLSLATVPAEDPEVYKMISAADTMGVFQIESRAQMAMLPRLRPACFYDLVIEVAIVRPGPIQGDMVHPYLRRRAGEEPVEYPDEAIRAVLEKTMGVPIFQEQAMRLAVVAAGFTPGEADQLRRAMGAWRRPGVIDQFHRKLIDGMQANGYPAEFAERVFRQIRGFGEYGFPESHAASFALLVYVSSWLKRYYPAAFAAALLNSQPMGFYAPAQLVADAKKHGVEIRPADVNFSDWDCTLEPADRDEPGDSVPASEPASSFSLPPSRGKGRGWGGERHPTLQSNSDPASTKKTRSGPHANPRWALRLGLRLIGGLSQAFAERIAAARGERPFRSIDEFARRTGLTNAVLARLSRADAFRSLGLGRRNALWHSLPERKQLLLFEAVPSDEPAVELPPLSPLEEVVADYQTHGLSLRDHPVRFMRATLKQKGILSSAELAAAPHGKAVRVAGLVLMRQRPSTAKGITFVTLEDETGIVNLIVRPEIWERHHQIARRSQALLARGTVQRRDAVIHVFVERLQDLSRLLAGTSVKSRDFR